MTIVEVMFAVVSRKVDSAHAAMQQHGEALGASVAAFYKKLNGTEPAVSTALVAHSFARGRELVTEMGGLCPEALPGWRLRILDGNHLAAPSVDCRRSGRSPRAPCQGWRWWSSTWPLG